MEHVAFAIIEYYPVALVKQFRHQEKIVLHCRDVFDSSKGDSLSLAIWQEEGKVHVSRPYYLFDAIVFQVDSRFCS